MNLNIDKENKLIHLSNFNLTSQEVIDLAKRFKEYNFTSEEYYEFDEQQEENGTTLVFKDNVLMDYTSETTCSCYDKSNCEKLDSCKIKNKYIN